jgi:glycogen(starch) synthase
MKKPKADFLIEVAYEVANLKGGIYTVLTTKSKEMVKYYGKGYYCIGPYNAREAKVEFEELELPEDFAVIFKELETGGIKCHYGKWLIPGEPQTILVDYKGRMKNTKGVKKKVTEDYNVDCSKCGIDYKHRSMLSDSISKLLEKMLNLPRFSDKKGVLHEHISGYPGIDLLDAKERNAKIGLVATTHSTRLGRDIAISNEDLFREIKERKDKGVGEKREYGYGGWTVAEHQFEKACVKACDVLTSVSDITSKECKYIFGRAADVVTPNGIDLDKYPTIEERAVLHSESKEKIWKFLEAYFLPYYPAKVEESLLMMISGRYEFHTKGFDVFIESLGKLNYILKEEEYPKNIFVFFFVLTGDRKKPNYEVLENLSNYEQIGKYIDDKMPEIEKRAIETLVHGGNLKDNQFFDSEIIMESRKLMGKFRRETHRRPPLCALSIGGNDVIFNSLKSNGLLNREEDKIKVIVYPARIAIGDGLLSMDYYDVMAGMHLGVFPSSYEPWGYTPLETAAYSVLSITSDLSGFGQFVKKNTDQRKKPGVLVLRREDRNREEIVKDLYDMLYWVSKLTRDQRVKKKIDAKNVSNLANWKDFSQYYIQAHDLAVERCEKRCKKKS